MEQFKIDLNETRLKKRPTMYEDFAHSHQSFDQVGMFEAAAGYVILRGRNGRRDTLYPPERAIHRIHNFFKTYQMWMSNGFTVQCQQLKLVLAQFIAKFQESMVQRIATNDVPKWYTPVVAMKLTNMLKILNMKPSSQCRKTYKMENFDKERGSLPTGYAAEHVHDEQSESCVHQLHRTSEAMPSFQNASSSDSTDQC